MATFASLHYCMIGFTGTNDNYLSHIISFLSGMYTFVFSWDVFDAKCTWYEQFVIVMAWHGMCVHDCLYVDRVVFIAKSRERL